MLEIVRCILEAIGVLTTLVALLALVVNFAGWLLGIAPLMKRLGLGRWYREICVVAGKEYKDLETDLVNSGVFRGKNIRQVSLKNLADIKNADLLLVDYRYVADKIDEVLSNKQSRAGMVVYYPIIDKDRISDDVAKRINNQSHTTLTNFRGRLINDILITLISTSYEKK
jgi:hypothetical protein